MLSKTPDFSPFDRLCAELSASANCFRPLLLKPKHQDTKNRFFTNKKISTSNLNFVMRNLFFLLTLSVLLIPCSLQARSNVDTPLATRLHDHVAILSTDSMEGRGLGTEGKIRAKNYIAEQFREAGLEAFEDGFLHHLDLRIGLARVPGTNVVGYLKGSNPAMQDEYILIGAHYDHLGYTYENDEKVIYPGADDNASGTATMIELARYFGEHPEALERSIIFVAFDAEESGLLGAEKFINNHTKVDKEAIRVMFSIDMVGMYDANSGVDMWGIGTLDGGIAMAGRIADATSITIRNTSGDIPPRTDTWPFGETGIPSIHVFTGTESPYHKPEDTWDLLDYDGMANITRYLQSLVSEISAQPELTPSRRFVRLQRPYAPRFDFGVAAGFGSSHHHYKDAFFRANPVSAFQAGIFMQVHIGRRLSLQPELLYGYHGSEAQEGRYRKHAITLPLHVHFNLIEERNGMFRLYPFAGGYYRHNIAGNAGDRDLDFDGVHPGEEWGVSAGVGADFMMLHVTWTWRRGLTDISWDQETEVFDRSSMFTIGYTF